MELFEVIRPREINIAVRRLATEINRDYKGMEPVVVGVLKGSFIFLSDLVRHLKMPVEVDFIRAASYGSGMKSSEEVVITRDMELGVAGRDVIVIEDIVDTGHTLRAILRCIDDKKPRSVRVCTLLDKPSRRVAECSLDYVGIEVEDRFLVGYGLDCAEKYRNLKGIYEAVETGTSGT